MNLITFILSYTILQIVLMLVALYLVVGILLGIKAMRISPLTRKLPKSTVVIGFIMYAVFWIPMQYSVRKSRKDRE